MDQAMDSETRAVDKISQEKDLLLEQFFEAVNDLFLSFCCDGIRVKTERLVDLKRKITQLDPNWTLKDFYNCPVFRILSYLDKLYIEEVNFVANEILGLKISLEIGEMRAKNPSWRLNEKVMLQFLRANS
jgi:hypothetical protein